MEDEKYDKSIRTLNAIQNPQSRAAQKKAVYVTDIQKMGVNPNSIIGANAATKKDKFLSTAPLGQTSLSLEEKITHNSKFFRFTSQTSTNQQETTMSQSEQRSRRPRLQLHKNSKYGD